MENKKLWYAVQKDSTDEWGNGSFNKDEAIEMCNADDRYTLIAVIDGGYDEDGNETTDAVCIEELYKGIDF